MQIPTVFLCWIILISIFVKSRSSIVFHNEKGQKEFGFNVCLDLEFSKEYSCICANGLWYINTTTEGLYLSGSEKMNCINLDHNSRVQEAIRLLEYNSHFSFHPYDAKIISPILVNKTKALENPQFLLDIKGNENFYTSLQITLNFNEHNKKQQRIKKSICLAGRSEHYCYFKLPLKSLDFSNISIDSYQLGCSEGSKRIKPDNCYLIENNGIEICKLGLNDDEDTNQSKSKLYNSNGYTNEIDENIL